MALAREWKPELGEYVESKLEGKFQLEINREKTRVVNLREKEASLDFLGYTFRYDRDLKGRDKRYLNVFPSKKAVQREWDKLHEMTNSHQCFKPIPDMIDDLNRHLKGWANYFSWGHVTSAYWEIDWFVRGRLIQHLQRRSQRPFHPPEGVPWYRFFQNVRLVSLARPVDSGPVHACDENFQESRTWEIRISGSTRGE